MDRLGCRLQREIRPPSPVSASPLHVPALAEGGVGDELRRMFDDVVSSPMPQSMIDLCDALEDAFRRGELKGCGAARDV